MSFRRSFCGLVALTSIGVTGVYHSGAQVKRRNPNVTTDPVVKTYPASISTLTGTDFEGFRRTLGDHISCVSKIFSQLPDPINPMKATFNNRHTAYLFHVAEWQPRLLGTFQITEDDWIAYKRVRAGGSCTLVMTGSKKNTTNDPLLYGISNVVFLGINHFKGSPDLNSISLGYDISTTPDTPQYIQDLGSLLYALLGATLPTSTTAATKAGGGPPPPPPPDVLVATAHLTDAPRLPFFINVTLTATLTSLGGLPDAQVGVPYSATVSASGGNGAYTFVVSSGTLPAGLSLDPLSGTISGTPSAASPTPQAITILATDNSGQANRQSIATQIAVHSSVIVKLGSSSSDSGQLESGSVGMPYLSGVTATGGKPPYNYSLKSNLPPELNWLNFSPTTGVISGVPQQVTADMSHLGTPAPKLSFTVSDSTTPSPLTYSFQTTITVGYPLSVTPAPVTAKLSASPKGTAYTVHVQSKGATADTKYSCRECNYYGFTISDDGMLMGTPQKKGVMSIVAKTNGTEKALPIAVDPTASPTAPPETLEMDSVDFTALFGSTTSGQRLDGVTGVPYLIQIRPGGHAYSCPACEDKTDTRTALDNLTVSTSGVISGTPKVSGDFWATLDADGETGAVPIKLVVSQPGLTLSLAGASPTQQNPQNQGSQQGPPSPSAQQPAGQGGPPQKGGKGQQPGGNQGGPANQGNNTQNNTQNNTSSTPQAVKCAFSVGNPCSFSRSIRSDDRELIDFGMAVLVPGPKERVFTNSSSSSVTTHTDVYALLDLFPFFPMVPMNHPLPHFVVGLPVTSQVFHRPIFGVSENISSWTGLERLGFPQVSLFGGVVNMQQRLPKSTGSLVTDRAIKPVFGVELSVSSLVSKIGSAAKGGGSNKGGNSGSGN